MTCYNDCYVGLSLYVHKTFQVNPSTNQGNDPLLDNVFNFVICGNDKKYHPCQAGEVQWFSVDQ